MMNALRPPGPEIQRAIEAFVVKPLATRMGQLARSSSPKAQRKLVNMLAHFEGFRPECIHPTKDNNYFDEVERLISKMGLADYCDVLSEDASLNGKRIPFRELFDLIDGSGFGTFAVIHPDRLAFFEGEDPGTSFILVQEGRQ